MVDHLFIPRTDILSIELHSEHRDWLERWLESIEGDIEDGNTASSICLQAALSELVLYGEVQHDWTEVLSTCLTGEEGIPLAYSAAFGKRLFKFESQWRQTPVHAIHSHFWLRKLSSNSFDATPFCELIEGLMQPNGWIYNPEVSPTQFRTRMKSEYMMSFAMGLEILDHCGRLTGRVGVFTATLVAESLTPYLGSEYFRIRALESLGKTEQAPVGLGEMVVDRKAGKGYCDFLASEKVDDYMGTAKRTGRDIGVHSPLSSLQARYLARYSSVEVQSQIAGRLEGFIKHLAEHPLDIPSFQIRDLSIPFGKDISPLEVIAASVIIHS